MSATEQQSSARVNGVSRPPEPGGLTDASLKEALAVLATGVVPALVRGLFAPRRGAMKLLTRVDADARAISVLTGLRRRHGGEGVRLLGGRLIVLWGADAIREVLDRSAELYASDAGAKAKGMSHFQPDALTLSRGPDWRDRRPFNEVVLASRERVHPDGHRFVEVVADEIDRMPLGQTLEWRDWERLFDLITLRVIFGDRARCDQRLTGLLETLMRQGNRLVGLKPNDTYYELYGALERHVRDAEPGSLLARFTEAPHSDRTRVVQQIPHWMFAMRDTLAANAYRALAAIVSDPAVERRVREDMIGADLSDPRAVDGMGYLGGCLHEAMRLWPTTPLLAREVTHDVALAGEHVPAGTQILILNTFNHRDPDHVEDADHLTPERWRPSSETPDYRFNHLSNGSQDCPGGPLVLLLGKAAIAQMLSRWTLKLEEPALPAGGPMPAMFDFYSARFTARRR
ncbi:MAG TPA: cytochrome P450 [Solirubrobacteraceae bacterium]|nr:cytochrome P450 [Solirubrobacteraceae bacterium]